MSPLAIPLVMMLSTVSNQEPLTLYILSVAVTADALAFSAVVSHAVNTLFRIHIQYRFVAAFVKSLPNALHHTIQYGISVPLGAFVPVISVLFLYAVNADQFQTITSL